MADYRLDCCGGFPGHRPDCPTRGERIAREREYAAQKREEDKRWNEFFDKMDDEQIFTYIKLCDDHVKRAERFRKRSERAKRYLRDRGRIWKYLDWTRN